ncbi:uncharacterized protein LOC124289622 [Haliotis rubra]|uniref:uncharacterized protein LOC124289622 n=1 Tax=Haliotis rubra TaxID=36100 RepID=UPI001EE5D61D|nr:uncharacterized protein LOC124289622 [Haliotis rubra]
MTDTSFLKPYRHIKLDCDDEKWLQLRENDEGMKVVERDNEWVLLEDLLQELGATIVEEETLPSPIAQVPHEGYTKKDQYSRVSIQWLEWLAHSKGIRIQHALNDGEFRIPGHKYSADGYCRETNTIYQFDGCMFHGCRACYPHNRDTTVLPRTQQSLSELYALTMKRNEFWKSQGYNLVTLWEHEFTEKVRSMPELKNFVEKLDLQERLDVRDSFFGGRTNAIKLYYEASEDEEILYQDFTSLYPSVNKYGRYPVGHPTIITRNFKALDQYFGIAKVKIQPPRGLYHPVLPYRSNGKLKFPLCRTCADMEQREHCEHTEVERCFIGTFCTPELLKALEKGYEIVKIYEVYHWSESTQYDPDTRTGGLFADYINTFLKIKQESSGWPAQCKDESDKQKYIADYFRHEGIHLEYEKIQKNPGLRALSKLSLNSFWGKFAQRSNMKQTKFINHNDLETFYSFLTDP